MTGYIILGLLAVAVGVVLFSPWLKGFRTQIFGALTVIWGAAVPLLTQITDYLQTLDWRQYLTPQMAPWIMIGLGVIFYILRRMTTTPIGEKA